MSLWMDGNHQKHFMAVRRANDRVVRQHAAEVGLAVLDKLNRSFADTQEVFQSFFG
jgi:hypothetical protein